MAPKTKPEFIAALRQRGEDPPTKWGMTELRTRLLELQEENGEINQKGCATELQVKVKEMNKASRRKPDLQAWCRTEMGMPDMPNATIAQLQKAAMEKIYMSTTAHPNDPVGFGEHASLNYAEIKETQKEYCQWVKTTYQEGDCNYRLARLARWLMKEPDQVSKKTDKTGNKIEKKKETPSQSTTKEDDTGALMQVMQQMVQRMESMQEEMEDLRGRSHKKPNRDEEMESQPWEQLSSKVSQP